MVACVRSLSRSSALVAELACDPGGRGLLGLVTTPFYDSRPGCVSTRPYAGSSTPFTAPRPLTPNQRQNVRGMASAAMGNGLALSGASPHG
jgi:hypothetical protein